MKKIDEYVSSIYADVSGKEANEMKEEMRTHLIEAVEELKGEGKSEEEAIDIALKRFGDEKQITKGLFSFFKLQNKIVKKLNLISLICLIIGLSYFAVGKLFFDETKTADKVANKISNVIGDDVVSEKEKEKINSIIEEEDFEYFALYVQPNSSSKFDFPDVYTDWTKIITYGDKQRRSEISLMGNLGVGEKWFYEIGYKTYPFLTSYAIPVSFIILSLIMGVVSFFLKQSIRKKVINRLLLN
jgi:ABC-type multidrug transport system fused ATPase/permease subunit